MPSPIPMERQLRSSLMLAYVINYQFVKDSIYLLFSFQVQQEFAFIPDDGSATYVINVQVSGTFENQKSYCLPPDRKIPP